MSRKFWLIVTSLLLVVALLGTIAGCAKPAPAPSPAPAPAPAPKPTPAPAPAPAPAPHKQAAITVLGGEVGGTGYTMVYALAELLNKKHPWIRATARATTGTAANLETLIRETERRKDTLIDTGAYVQWGVVRAMQPWWKEPYPDLKFVLRYMANASGLLAVDPKVKELDDLVGKKVGLFDKTGAANMEYFAAFLGKWGADWEKKIQIEYIGSNDARMQAVQNGLIAAGVGSVSIMPEGQPWIPLAWCTEVTAQPNAHFVNLPAEVLKKGAELGGYPNSPVAVPAGAWKAGVPAYGTVLIELGLGADAAMDPELVYEIVKFWVENRADFIPYTASAKRFDANFFGVWGPAADEKAVHPGALKYYKEKGLPVGLAK